MADPRKAFENMQCAEFYRKYRLDWPPEIIEIVVGFLAEKKTMPFALAVDVGCGTGQSSRPLAPYFDKVIGIDNSEAQLKNAGMEENAPNIEYRHGSAEKIPLSDKSVDLITIAVAVQWVIYDDFIKEVDRVLKPGGCIAMWGHYYQTILNSDKITQDKLGEVTDQFLHGKEPGSLGDCANYSHHHLMNRYADFTIPYNENKRVMDILNVDTAPEDTPITIRQPVFMLLGRKPE